MRIASVIFTVALLASGAVAQPASTAIHVGDGAIDGRRLQPYDNLWIIRVRFPDGHVEDRGLSSDHVRFQNVGSHRVMTRIEGTTIVRDGDPLPRDSASSTFNVFDPATMAPAYGESTSSDGQWRRQTFDGLHVTTVTHDAHGQETITQTTLAEPVYDYNGGMTGLILAALPLRLGYAATMPALGDNGAERDEIAVERRERIAAGRLGRVDAWVVRVGPPSDGTHYWISARAPYVIKVEIERLDHSVASWTML
jgi:hypothetical protein